eukprot:7632419-Lingulodinium_polyedra.AAC.1
MRGCSGAPRRGPGEFGGGSQGHCCRGGSRRARRHKHRFQGVVELGLRELRGSGRHEQGGPRKQLRPRAVLA